MLWEGGTAFRRGVWAVRGGAAQDEGEVMWDEGGAERKRGFQEKEVSMAETRAVNEGNRSSPPVHSSIWRPHSEASEWERRKTP